MAIITGIAAVVGAVAQIVSSIQGAKDERERKKRLKEGQAKIRTMMQQEHPGMGPEEWRQAVGQIESRTRGQSAQLAQMQSRFGGSVDPGAFARANVAVQGQGTAARAGLSAQRAALDRQTTLAIEEALRTGDVQSAQLAMQGRQAFSAGLGGVGQFLGGLGQIGGGGGGAAAPAGGYMPTVGVTQPELPFARAPGPGMGTWNPNMMQAAPTGGGAGGAWSNPWGGSNPNLMASSNVWTR